MEIKKCERCGTEKTWNGDDITCPFQDSDKFGKNWNCGIINKIREICDFAADDVDPRLHYQYCEDQKYVCINIDNVEMPGERFIGLCLWVSWYKSRGETEAMWILNSNEPPREPTFEELEAIISYYTKVKNSLWQS